MFLFSFIISDSNKGYDLYGLVMFKMPDLFTYILKKVLIQGYEQKKSLSRFRQDSFLTRS